MQQKPGSTETRVAGVLFSHQGEGIDYLPKGLKLTHVYVNECQAIAPAVALGRVAAQVDLEIDIDVHNC